MIPTREQELIDRYRAARLAYSNDISDDVLFEQLEVAKAAIHHHLTHKGPIEDLANLTRFVAHEGGEIDEEPLAEGRFLSFALHGADSVAPGFRRYSA